MQSTPAALEGARDARASRSTIESSLAPVAGIAIHHVRDARIALADAAPWAGSRAFDEPLLVHHVIGSASVQGMRKQFDASPSCAYYDAGGETVVEFRGPVPGVPNQLLFARDGGHEYELVYEDVPAVPMYQRAKDRTIYSMALAHRGRGCIAHACGFVVDGAGVLCPGLPSAGKSTLATLLGAVEPPVTRLSDDRVAVTAEPDGLRIWGTPWPGDARVIGAFDGPLRRMLVMRHGTSPSLTPVAPTAAVRHLLDTLVLPLWDRTLLPGALDFVHRLVAEVPVLAFTSPPTIDAVTWMLEELRRGLDE